MNTCDYDRLAALEMWKRYGVKRYRKAHKCKECGGRSTLFNRVTAYCYACCIKMELRTEQTKCKPSP